MVEYVSIYLVKDDFMELKYLGQEGFLLKTEKACILIDPYLSDFVDRNSSVKNFVWKRAYEPPMCVDDFEKIDAVLLTHSHDDHTDPDTVAEIVRKKEETRFMISMSQRELLLSLGVKGEKVIDAVCEEKYKIADLTVIPIPAAHEELHPRDDIRNGVYDELGYIVKTKDAYVYHAGDCLVYDGLAELIKKHTGDDKPLIMLLPVNGRDEIRESVGIIGNMNEAEAASLFKACEAHAFIPMHHDLYPDNGVSNDKIKGAAMLVGVSDSLFILAPGESFVI